MKKVACTTPVWGHNGGKPFAKFGLNLPRKDHISMSWGWGQGGGGGHVF